MTKLPVSIPADGALLETGAGDRNMCLSSLIHRCWCIQLGRFPWWLFWTWLDGMMCGKGGLLSTSRSETCPRCCCCCCWWWCSSCLPLWLKWLWLPWLFMWLLLGRWLPWLPLGGTGVSDWTWSLGTTALTLPPWCWKPPPDPFMDEGVFWSRLDLWLGFIFLPRGKRHKHKLSWIYSTILSGQWRNCKWMLHIIHVLQNITGTISWNQEKGEHTWYTCFL